MGSGDRGFVDCKGRSRIAKVVASNKKLRHAEVQKWFINARLQQRLVHRKVVRFGIKPGNGRCDRLLLGRIGGEGSKQGANLLDDLPRWHRPEFAFEGQLLEGDNAIAWVLGRELAEEIQRRLFLAGDAA